MNSNKFFELVDKDVFRKYLNDTVLRAQRCQRNWDLTKKIPQEDLDLIIHSATQAPSKQNCDFFSLYVIQDRKTIEEIYENTLNVTGRRNPQVLANLLLVFVRNEVTTQKARTQDQKNIRSQQASEDDFRSYEIEAFQAAGVAAGFVNVAASSLGYQTGCNRCFDRDQVRLILGTEEKVLLMMGIGFKDENRQRREEHVTSQTIVSYDKPEIKVIHI